MLMRSKLGIITIRYFITDPLQIFLKEKLSRFCSVGIGRSYIGVCKLELKLRKRKKAAKSI